MVEVKDRLEAMNHKVVLPDPGKSHHLRAIKNNNYEDTYLLKRRYDYIRKHYNHIAKADCILIANWDKNGVKNYIGGNAFLEMGFAYILGKTIYMLNEIPDMPSCFHEVKAMEPIILSNNLSKLM